MTAKEYLKNLQHMERKITLDLAELTRLRMMAESITGTGYEEKYNPNSPTEAPFVKCMEKISEMEKKIEDEVSEYMDYYKKAMALIKKVEDFEEREVLEMRYARNLRWDDIASELHYSKRWAYKLHGMALRSFAKVLEMNEKKF